MNKLQGLAMTAAFAIGISVGVARAGITLDTVKGRGFLQCGVSQGISGFSSSDDKGNWKGIDVEVCRAVAAAIFGDGGKVKFKPLSTEERFTALQSGEIDLLSRNSTWTMSRDTGLGLNFVGVNYYDGQGFMVRKSLGVKSALQLSGAAVCTTTGTTTELNLEDYFQTHKMKYNKIAFENADEVAGAYDAGRCDIYTSDQSQLYAQRIKMKHPEEHIILPEMISKEPMGPVVRQGDDEWFNIVKWSLFCMIDAEELGLTSANIDSLAISPNPDLRRLLGMEGDLGKNFGLSNEWCKDIVKQVGNYGESFARNLGPNTLLKIDRGLNALWNRGGLLYAPPIR